MPVIPKKINVIKVPREGGSQNNPKTAPDFQRMPRMYLELLENKEKIKPNLVNKEYDPDEAESVYSFDGPTHDKDNQRLADIPRTIDEEKEDDENDQDDEDFSSVSSSSGTEQEPSNHDDNDTTSQASSHSSSSLDDKNDREQDTETATSGSLRSSQSSRSQTLSQHAIPEPVSKPDDTVKNATREKLRNLLFSEEGQKNAPTLAELKKRGEVKDSKVIPDLGRMNVESVEEEDELKRELLFKFELLKKSYNVAIPEFTMHSDYKSMNQTYENTLRHVSLDSNVESYKSLLVGGFMLLEFVLGFWLKFDMSGFTQQQILNMTQYERLLVELGEKSYVPGGSQWPVELRLLGLIVMNAIIFIISKIILKKTGSNLVGLMNSVNTMMPQASARRPKRRMKGPSVDLNSIPDVEDDETTRSVSS